MKAARQGYDQARLRAISIYLELANRSDASAMYNLGYMCLHDRGGEQDPNVCIEWLENAGKIGHDNSLKLLTKIYSEGLYGIPSDEEKATYWHNLQAAFASGIDGR
jgi:TPR repeat protein